jgi:hypothetical protein
MTNRSIKRLALFLLVVMTSSILATAVARAEAAKPEGPQPKSQVTRPAPLAEKDLQGQFDPKHEKFSYLLYIGKTIDDARQKADAETLAIASMMLYQAEKVSGKKSPDLTAAALLDEATKLAEAQKNPVALQACAAVWGDQSFGPNDAARSKTLAQKAQVYSVERQSAKRGVGRLYVKNQTKWAVNIYVDDEYVGALSGYENGSMRVNTGSTKLYATAQYHDYSWGPRFTAINDEYTWTLND